MKYQEFYGHSITDPESFWGKAGESIEWIW